MEGLLLRWQWLLGLGLLLSGHGSEGSSVGSGSYDGCCLQQWWLLWLVSRERLLAELLFLTWGWAAHEAAFPQTGSGCSHRCCFSEGGVDCSHSFCSLDRRRPREATVLKPAAGYCGAAATSTGVGCLRICGSCGRSALS
uniref:Secreted protein n=1 Tax=Pipistrellus kuhlii TaxID=59472 RepID=A0A7J7ZK00_PIPKU|nr:hypothetical protein mPipKuh1_009499 [Pipistrellus kuhlii]